MHEPVSALKLMVAHAVTQMCLKISVKGLETSNFGPFQEACDFYACCHFTVA